MTRRTAGTARLGRASRCVPGDECARMLCHFGSHLTSKPLDKASTSWSPSLLLLSATLLQLSVYSRSAPEIAAAHHGLQLPDLSPPTSRIAERHGSKTNRICRRGQDRCACPILMGDGRKGWVSGAYSLSWCGRRGCASA